MGIRDEVIVKQQEQISQLQQLLSEKEKEIEYWRQRCLMVEEWVDIDPLYLTKAAKIEWDKYQSLKNQKPTTRNPIST